MATQATTAQEYLAEMPEKWRPIVAQLYDLVTANLANGFDECIRWGMITFEVPMSLSGETYNGQPLQYISLGAKKNHVGLYMNGLYASKALTETFHAAYEAAGVKPDMGKSDRHPTSRRRLYPGSVRSACPMMGRAIVELSQLKQSDNAGNCRPQFCHNACTKHTDVVNVH